ncbi:hypothetical protein PoB_002661200 [Plakobranchus ocellatus]|uniref:Uncharacterized protein n=1 Tax=Plakobranchus ocellatus TaxID=259542 RepID=A0AAV3ZZK6_9GAST|nr:hypothetical protein PoB_002661200 [Plakobranchus ocellatus]
MCLLKESTLNFQMDVLAKIKIGPSLGFCLHKCIFGNVLRPSNGPSLCVATSIWSATGILAWSTNAAKLRPSSTGLKTFRLQGRGPHPSTPLRWSRKIFFSYTEYNHEVTFPTDLSCAN